MEEQLSHGDIGIGIGSIAPKAGGASLITQSRVQQALNSFVAQSMQKDLQIEQQVLDAFSELSIARKYRYLILCSDPSGQRAISRSAPLDNGLSPRTNPHQRTREMKEIEIAFFIVLL